MTYAERIEAIKLAMKAHFISVVNEPEGTVTMITDFSDDGLEKAARAADAACLKAIQEPTAEMCSAVHADILSPDLTKLIYVRMVAAIPRGDK